VPVSGVDNVAGEWRHREKPAPPASHLEVIMQDDFMGRRRTTDQVDAARLKSAGEQQMRIRNNNGVGRRMARNSSDMDVRTG